MIEIITEKVEIPDLDKLRFKKECKNFGSRSEKWFVIDTETKTVRYKGNFDNVSLVCHNLNKKYYRDINAKKNYGKRL